MLFKSSHDRWHFNHFLSSTDDQVERVLPVRVELGGITTRCRVRRRRRVRHAKDFAQKKQHPSDRCRRVLALHSSPVQPTPTLTHSRQFPTIHPALVGFASLSRLVGWLVQRCPSIYLSIDWPLCAVVVRASGALVSVADVVAKNTLKTPRSLVGGYVVVVVYTDTHTLTYLVSMYLLCFFARGQVELSSIRPTSD